MGEVIEIPERSIEDTLKRGKKIVDNKKQEHAASRLVGLLRL